MNIHLPANTSYLDDYWGPVFFLLFTVILIGCLFQICWFLLYYCNMFSHHSISGDLRRADKPRRSAAMHHGLEIPVICMCRNMFGAVVHQQHTSEVQYIYILIQSYTLKL